MSPQAAGTHLFEKSQLTNQSSHQPAREESLYPFEESMVRQIEVFNFVLLVWARQAFDMVSKYLDLILCCPSYSINARLSARHRSPLPDEVHGAIFCIGGLNAVVRFAEIPNLEERRGLLTNF
jgi:hypothetical protein